MEKVTVTILNDQDKLPVTAAHEKLIRDTVRAVLSAEGPACACEVTVKLINNNKIRYLNKKMRGIDRITDVLSFPSGDDAEEDIAMCGSFDLGDMAISLERAQRQSVLYGHSFTRELAFLVAHSMLHLLGYDHMTPEEETEMFEKQEEILIKMGITR